MSEELLDVQINGEWHSFPKGTRMIEACREAGVEVPHYCYHPKLTSPGNCRMCLVEMGMPPRPRPGDDPPEPDSDGHLPISWIPRPAIACANTIAPNMGIRTESEMTEQCREGVMELLLANHPLDCPICDQAGECSLQEFSVEHGNGESRFREQKVKKPKNVDIGPRIRLDDERCIMCSRCIRFMDEVADEPVLGFTDHGSHTTLAIFPGHELDSNYSLNTADICPVGALTSNDFRFQMRVWFLKETETIDVNCGTGTNITVYARENQIYRIRPRQNNEVNSDWMPDSHRLSFHWINGDDRLTAALIKTDGTHAVTRWQEAIDYSAAKLGEFSGSEIAVIGSGKLFNEDLFLIDRLSKHLEVGHIDTVAREGEPDPYLISADRNPNSLGVKTILGIDHHGMELKAIREGIEQGRIKALISFQEDLIGDAGFDEKTLAALDFLLVSHPRANPSAEYADVVLPSTCWAEKMGSMLNIAGRLQRLQPAVDPPGEARATWEICRDLIQASGGGNGIYSSLDVLKQLSSEIPEFAGITWGKIGNTGLPLIETDVKIPLIEREKERIASGLIVG